MSTPKWRDYINRACASYRKANPEKLKAHTMAWNHRKLLRKAACEKCANTEKLHMHHPDYKKPQSVITLCVPCHEEVHHAI